MTLRAYRLSCRGGDAARSGWLAYRRKRGKENPDRAIERRGETAAERPDGPLVWVHGASVGELLAVLPLIERLRAKEFRVLVTSGTVTSANLARDRLPPDVIHQFIPLDTPRFVCAISQSLAARSRHVHRIRYLAEPDHRERQGGVFR